MTRRKTQKMCTMAVAIVMAGVALAAENAAAVTMQFGATRDQQIQAFSSDEQLRSRGGKTKIRALNSVFDVALMDFDTAAMQAFLAANPGPATWTLNVAPIAGGAIPPDGLPTVTVMTVESTNDWVEVDEGKNPLEWETPSAATYFYAQTVHNGGVLGVDRAVDPVNSLEWIDPDSGPYTFTPNVPAYALNGVPTTVGGGDATTADNPTPEFTNSTDWSWVDLQAAQDSGGFASLAMDDAIINAMIVDVNNRGLRFGPLEPAVTASWRIWSREESGLGAYLEVNVVPEPSAAILATLGMLGFFCSGGRRKA